MLGGIVSSVCVCHLAQVSVRVTTMDAELEFAIQSSTTGKQLFDQVSSSTYMTCFTVCFIMCVCYSLLYTVVSQYT